MAGEDFRGLEKRVGEHETKLAVVQTRLDGHGERLKELDLKKADQADFAWAKRILMAIAMTSISGWLASFGKILTRVQ